MMLRSASAKGARPPPNGLRPGCGHRAPRLLRAQLLRTGEQLLLPQLPWQWWKRPPEWERASDPEHKFPIFDWNIRQFFGRAARCQNQLQAACTQRDPCQTRESSRVDADKSCQALSISSKALKACIFPRLWLDLGLAAPTELSSSSVGPRSVLSLVWRCR